MIATQQMTTAIIEHKGLRQFVKFCLVGASSTVVNFAVLNVVYFGMHVHLIPSITLAFIVSVCNGFIWNRRWTFKETRHNAAHEQAPRFLLVNIVGWLLNTSIVVLIIAHYTTNATGGLFGDWTNFQHVAANVIVPKGATHYSRLLVNGSQFAASCVVVFWNYFANRLWTFKH